LKQGFCFDRNHRKCNPFLNASLLFGYVSTTKSVLGVVQRKDTKNKAHNFLNKLKKKIFSLQKASELNLLV